MDSNFLALLILGVGVIACWPFFTHKQYDSRLLVIPEWQRFCSDKESVCRPVGYTDDGIIFCAHCRFGHRSDPIIEGNEYLDNTQTL